MQLIHKYAGAEWLKAQPGIKAEKITDFACKVADILGLTYEGLYHLRNDTVFYRKAEWYNPHQITIYLFRELATFDGSDLTKLVLFCHTFSVRLAIRPTTVKREYEGHCYEVAALELQFDQRKPEGKWHERHPSLEEAIGKFQQYVYSEKMETENATA